MNRLAPWGLLSTIWLIAACGNTEPTAQEDQDAFFSGRDEIPPFSFIDQNGQPFTRDSVRGKVYVADFFFTSCQTICPKMTDALKTVQEDLRGYSDFRIVSHTLDPKNDSVPRLKAYGEEHGVVDGTWYLVTGERADIYGLAENVYFNTAKYGDGTPEGILHNPMLILVDRNGSIIGYYDAQDPQAVDKLKSAARKLLQA